MIKCKKEHFSAARGKTVAGGGYSKTGGVSDDFS